MDHFLPFQDHSVLHVRRKNKLVAFPPTLVRVSVESATNLNHNRFLSLGVCKFLGIHIKYTKSVWHELWDSALTSGRNFVLVIVSRKRNVAVWKRKYLENFLIRVKLFVSCCLYGWIYSSHCFSLGLFYVAISSSEVTSIIAFAFFAFCIPHEDHFAI